MDEKVLSAAWLRNLSDLRRHWWNLQRLGILDHETALCHYMDIMEKVEQDRSQGKVLIQVCPSDNAWEGKCEEPGCIVSPFCAKHAALYDRRQVFFTCCSQCKEQHSASSTDTVDTVAFHYSHKGNLCIQHQIKAIGSRKKPPMRRLTGPVLHMENLQRLAVPQVLAQYRLKNAVPSISGECRVASFSDCPFELTCPVTPETPVRRDSPSPYYHDEDLDLNVQEVVLDTPLAQADFNAVLDDVFEDEETSEFEKIASCDDISLLDDSLITHMDWTLQVLDEMEWRSVIELETLR